MADMAEIFSLISQKLNITEEVEAEAVMATLTETVDLLILNLLESEVIIDWDLLHRNILLYCTVS